MFLHINTENVKSYSKKCSSLYYYFVTSLLSDKADKQFNLICILNTRKYLAYP